MLAFQYLCSRWNSVDHRGRDQLWLNSRYDLRRRRYSEATALFRDVRPARSVSPGAASALQK